MAIRSFLKWAGGKYNCLPQILSQFPHANRLIEPFAGSAVIFANTNYPTYLLTEANFDLINLFTQLKQEGPTFIDYCENFFLKEHNNSIYYYALRHQFNHASNLRERAGMFLYLNRHGYNGLCRYNSTGSYNVPFGHHAKTYFPRIEMLHFFHKSEKATFIHCDYQETFQLAQTGDLIYCDPPYVPLSKTASFANYTGQSFNEKEQIQLAKLALETAAQGIPVIISNHDTDFTRKHYQNAQIISFLVKRQISCKVNNRIPVRELLAVFK